MVFGEASGTRNLTSGQCSRQGLSDGNLHDIFGRHFGTISFKSCALFWIPFPNGHVSPASRSANTASIDARVLL